MPMFVSRHRVSLDEYAGRILFETPRRSRYIPSSHALLLRPMGLVKLAKLTGRPYDPDISLTFESGDRYDLDFFNFNHFLPANTLSAIPDATPSSVYIDLHDLLDGWYMSPDCSMAGHTVYRSAGVASTSDLSAITVHPLVRLGTIEKAYQVDRTRGVGRETKFTFCDGSVHTAQRDQLYFIRI